jgi:integration host factor subunit beta
VLDLRASHQVPSGQDTYWAMVRLQGAVSNVNPGEGTLNGRWDEGCLTGPVILGTFRTPEGFAVIKSELVDRISIQNPHLYRQDAEKIVNTIFSEITAAMARGDRVELRGFGVFFVRVREGRTGRNPRTGALVSVGSKAVPLFRSGREMKSLLNSYAHGSYTDTGDTVP